MKRKNAEKEDGDYSLEHVLPNVFIVHLIFWLNYRNKKRASEDGFSKNML
ncbi:hypothetical protein GCM10025882_16430 [Acinetobacter gyllenbergii]|nr:hypothetical protein GCM10025882_16430 [Acinetobacter gyllenbergii]